MAIGTPRSVLEALRALMDIIDAVCPELRCSGTWEPREAYADGLRPKRHTPQVHVWQGDRGGPIIHVTALHDRHKRGVIWYEAHLEPVGDEPMGKFRGRARLGDDLGPFLDQLVTWTAPGAGRVRALPAPERSRF